MGAVVRRLAIGTLAVGSTAALLIGGATYAPFSDSASGSGTVGAGSVDVRINGLETATFSMSTDECDNMAPGIDCVETFTVDAGTSSLSAVWAATVGDSETDIDCFTSSVDLANGTAETDDADLDHDPGAGETGTLTVSVADNNACQGAAATIVVDVAATQSPSPHN